MATLICRNKIKNLKPIKDREDKERSTIKMLNHKINNKIKEKFIVKLEES